MDVTEVVDPHWRKRIGWETMSTAQRQAIAEFGLQVYGLATPTVSDIDEVKYDGRLIILEDGSRWEVDAADASEADLWSTLDSVIVIDDVMYNVEGAEHVDVTEES